MVVSPLILLWRIVVLDTCRLLNCYHASPRYFQVLKKICAMAKHVVDIELVAFLATILLYLPAASMCARIIGTTGTVANPGYSTVAVPNADSCPTDFSQISYEAVKAACPAGGSQGATSACCAAFNNKACQYEAQVNNFGSTCPMLFINYLAAAGPYPAGYFVGPCVDGSKGFCVRK